MLFDLAIGKRTESVDVPDKNVLAVLTPNDVPRDLTGEAEVRRALENPIGSKRLRDIVKPGERIAIITSDVTRPMPTYKVMPALMEELSAAGVGDDMVTVVFALGSHRRQTEDERKRLVGDEIFDRVRCVDSDTDDTVHLGVTKRGTPVDVTRVVAEADRRILLGNIEYHYFAGYSGGAKAIMPGVSTRAAIQSNHSRMVEPTSRAGAIDGNGVRADIEEAAAMCGADFILNVVLDEHKEIIRAVAGDMTLAHREGCKFLDALFLKELPRRADIVIASQGGAPKDLNLYQTQKALDNARHAVRKGGVIILVGSCREGLGEAVFERWMKEADSPSDLIARVKTHFELGGHKAAAIAMALADSDVMLVSDMPDEKVRECFLEPAGSLQGAFDEAMRRMGKDASVTVMPYAGSTLPKAPE